MNDYSNDRFFEVSGGSIVRGPFQLPQSTKNSSGIWNLSLAELASRGFYRQVRIGDDAYDDATQVKEGPVNAVVGETVESTWTIRAKTAQELDDDDEALIDSALRNPKLQKWAFRVTNEALEGNGKPTITPQQFRNWFKNL